MSFSRFILGSAAALFVAASAPSTARAQAWKTACNDGTTTSATGANACDAHGGIHKARTEARRRTPTQTTRTAPGHVTQAGTPAPTTRAKPQYEERRGWRWGRGHEQRKESRREERREEKHRRVRCRDGKYENAEGKAKGRDICKHHGGLAH
jgi:hypothetical protein